MTHRRNALVGSNVGSKEKLWTFVDFFHFLFSYITRTSLVKRKLQEIECTTSKEI